MVAKATASLWVTGALMTGSLISAANSQAKMLRGRALIPNSAATRHFGKGENAAFISDITYN